MALGSWIDSLPKKLSSSIAVSELWTSVPPTKPNLNGFVAELRLELQAPQQAAAQVVGLHHLRLSGLSSSVRLPYSQPATPRSPANSSFGEIVGCVSLLPFVWMISCSTSQRARRSA